MYPRWSFDINYVHLKQPLIDWKYFILKLYKQKSYLSSSQFQLEPILSPKSKSFKIQEPFISDIDPITNTGVIAISKYCKFTRHKILFYTYPTYQLIRKFEFKFQIDDTVDWSCQIIGMQTITIKNKKTRLFAISINQPSPIIDEEEEEEEEEDSELKTLWKVILIYKLDHDGTTTCLAHLETSSLFLGRGTWFFTDINEKKTRDWLQIISPDTVNDYSASTVFLLAYGISMNTFAGYSQIIQFDLEQTNNDLLDPTKTVYRWDEEQDQFVVALPQEQTTNNAKVISTFYLGARVSCMIHFRYPHPLSNLICTGNFLRNELSIYDWRFGIKVGIFMHSQQTSVQPWGFEAGWAITPPLNPQDYLLYGPRLIVVGDYQDKFQIKIWDISHLLKVKWDPFDNSPVIQDERPTHHPWWDRKTNQLKKVALDTEQDLPFTISHNAVKSVHLLDAQIKFTAYINLNTWLYLLHEDGHLSVMDIESGEILNTIYTGGIAENVNVIGESEIIVTRKERLLTSLLP